MKELLMRCVYLFTLLIFNTLTLVEYKGPGLRMGERGWFKFNVRPNRS